MLSHFLGGRNCRAKRTVEHFKLHVVHTGFWLHTSLIRLRVTAMLFTIPILLCAYILSFAAAKHFTHQLNRVWSNREIHSPLAKLIAANQDTCTEKVYFHHMQNTGMGSDLHTWTQAVCNSLQYRYTLVQMDEEWIWSDKSFCNEKEHRQPLSCYFGKQLDCANSTLASKDPIDWNNKFYMCESYIHDIPSRMRFRAAAIEYLFANVSPRLIALAEKAIVEVFGPEGIPEDLITVHLRWGDKKVEMQLVHQTEYFHAIEEIAFNHRITKPRVFITTESHEGLLKLTEEIALQGKSNTWKVFHYAPAVYEGNFAPDRVAVHSQGGLGLHSLVSLLLAMEAKYYILTSGSNWSRLIDELRTNVVDVACGNCSDILDLREGFQSHNWRR